MKRKQISELHHKSRVELYKELTEKHQELSKLRLEKGVTPPKNTRTVRGLRQDIARILTITRQQELKEKKV